MKRLLILSLLVFGLATARAQETKGYVFTDVKTVDVTSVKDQSRSGTCWSFSGNALLENDILRNGKGEVDLSEMWIVRWTYYDKAVKYVRMHGTINFAAGAGLPDVVRVLKEYGAVPEEVYSGLEYGMDNHNHNELDAVLTAYIKGVVQAGESKPATPLTPKWKEGINGILDAYLGPIPEKFTYKGVEYTPKSFASAMGLDANDYINITSYNHHPFYTQFPLEVPDNWVWANFWNLPLNEMMDVMDNAIDNGYAIAWASDVSEKGFAYNKGLAVVPEANVDNMEGTEQARWVAMTDRDRQAALYRFEEPGPEKKITQEDRQKAFDNYETTDDHGMLITGKAVDQAGNKYFKVKNSWGTGNIYNGYFYASYPFVAYKTMSITINKNALPKSIKNKLNIK